MAGAVQDWIWPLVPVLCGPAQLHGAFDGLAPRAPLPPAPRQAPPQHRCRVGYRGLLPSAHWFWGFATTLVRYDSHTI